jgi:cyanophycinase
MSIYLGVMCAIDFLETQKDCPTQKDYQVCVLPLMDKATSSNQRYTVDMHYMLNGGRNERGVLVSPQALALYRQLKIKRVLFIVYALAEDFWQSAWKEAQSLIGIPGMELRALTTYTTDRVEIESALAWADFIYFPGGSQQSLLNRMHTLDTDRALEAVISKGTLRLLGGGSAGAMVMGSWCIVGHKDIKQVVPGLNYLPGYVIDSHFSERNRLQRLQAVMRDLPMIVGMGIDEDTAVVFDERLTIQAIYGPGSVTICDNKITRYDTNSTFPT